MIGRLGDLRAASLKPTYRERRQVGSGTEEQLLGADEEVSGLAGRKGRINLERR